MSHSSMDRRSLVKSAALGGLALILPFSLPRLEAKEAKKLGVSQNHKPLNAFLLIRPDNSVTIYSKHLEMGQGVYTGLATILADELDADWQLVRVESSAADATIYRNLFRGNNQGTGGSNSIANSWGQLRTAGAQARTMLLAAAAERWHVPAAELKTEKSLVLHPKSGRKLTYGELVPLALKQNIPENPPLKSRDQFRLIGVSRKMRVDGQAKVHGEAKFAIDVHQPGQLVALLARPPRFGATLQKAEAKAALAIKGVVEVVKIPQGVAVLAENFWAAKKGRDALELTWDETLAFKKSTTDIEQDFANLLQKSGAVAFSSGDTETQSKNAAKTFEAVYTLPYVAHTPLEPLNCVIKVGRKSCEIWAGSQSQTRDQTNAARILGLSPEQVRIHTMFAGGSFGRRSNPTSDYISEAAEIAKASRHKERPIHLMWTREDDLRGGYYRSLAMHRVVAGVDASGQALFWHHRIATQSIRKALVSTPPGPQDIDPSSVEGAANLSYGIPNRQCELHSPDLPIPVLWWRSVGHSHTAFVVESAMDELAALADKDPVEFRLGLLKDQPRLAAVLRKAAAMAEWGRTLPPGTGLGVAVHPSFGSFVAEVAQVTVHKGTFRVDKVWCAVDCGIAVNPDIIRAQMEGGIGLGLSAMQREAIHFAEGRVVESNFHNYRPLRVSEMPQVEVAIITSDADPTGVGEPGVPPIAPAVANAIRAATGKRVRTLPVQLDS